ncbi:MAG: hypothetical protein M3279_00700 [Actinomycetota bacterium]|nr:hypothetical protein [Actinomycetota bacterium]
MRRWSPLLALAVLLVGGSVLSSVASATPAQPSEDQGRPEHAGPPEGLKPGDVLEDHGVSVVVPEPGVGVYSEAIMPRTEVPQELAVSTEPDGTVVVESYGSEADATTAPGSGPLNPFDNGCEDGAYNLHNWKRYNTLSWYYNTGGTPSYLAALDVENAMKRGTTNVTQANNDCGFSDNITASQSYAGRTSTGIQVTSSGTCGTSDSSSVAKFGSLSNGSLATTCTWYTTADNPDRATTSDVRFNPAFEWATSTVQCVSFGGDAYMVDDVMTHERGHNFGIAHVSESSHEWLTMSTNSQGPCDTSQTTLGLGDYNGLNVRY